ncbi:MAG: TRAP transporter large permease [Pusillimonas sp.]
MSWTEALVIYSLVLSGCLVGGVGIGVSMGFVGVLGISLASGMSMWPTLASVIWNSTTDFELTAIPLFILMGELILQCGIASRFYSGVAGWFRRVPGGLAQTNIAGSAVFSAVCGSSVATALTIGSVAIKEMRQRGYDDRLTFGTITGGACLGILIPPSIPLIVYASMTQESVIDLFMGGVIPGLVLAGLFSVFIAVKALAQPHLLPPRNTPPEPGALMRGLRDSMPIIILILSVIGGMYFGIVTPTEAAGLGVVVALVLSKLYGKLSFQLFANAVRNTLLTSAVIMFITICAQVLSFAVVSAGIGQGLADWLVNLDISPFLFFTFLVLIYLVIGIVIDGLSIMLLTVPVLYLPLKALGFDGVWIGILMVVFIELGALTPPVGLNLFAVQSIAPGATMSSVSWSSLPYCLIILAFAFLLYFFPQIVLWLPQSLK